MPEPSPPTDLEILERMWLIRAFEEKVSELYAAGEVVGLIHLGIGQEGSAVGTCAALRSGDYVFGTHRSHAHAIAKGADIRRLMAEIAGRSTGYCKGKGGSMHISAPEVGFITATGVVAGNLPLALGAALTSVTRKENRVSVAFFGDGAGQSGPFHESLNLAALWKLPVVLVCENNGYVEFSPLSAHTVVERLADYATVYSIPSVTVDGGDVLAVRAAVEDAVAVARGGAGPAFVEVLTHRLRGHYEGDPARYRTLAERDEWKQRDPVARFAGRLRDCGVPRESLDEAEVSARAAVGRAAEEALADPPADRRDLTSDVYV
ncbi:thiamine pyrophosphate-dependent dehydrogenase E1 component subunit alpha [Candidatus Spongiisocius sp.]|uniref:thiamine pyrophosphate-dependent dehydrogenase E1 component subunit alpha n=1 Tax=Candidatus Spongiisocius sp. TaxID=3101273 RepID=UPI003B5954B2